MLRCGVAKVDQPVALHVNGPHPTGIIRVDNCGTTGVLLAAEERATEGYPLAPGEGVGGFEISTADTLYALRVGRVPGCIRFILEHP